MLSPDQFDIYPNANAGRAVHRRHLQDVCAPERIVDRRILNLLQIR
jgi:hypothetical protein